ncbi:MAG: succinylglutamate desuccinylase/aspartoacylase family protein [Methylobacteriaceae bacterium]|nr:succinylglutamate desuccinylase/aspartoacylase family protein [Methylobacteriaceae bacterium]
MTEAPVLETIRFTSSRPGPRLLVLGAVHGNETCGPQAIARAVAEMRSGSIALRRGAVSFVPVANPKAHAQNTREGDRNLNRDLAERAIPQDNEDRLGNLLCPLIRAHDVLLDIHSFRGDGTPFVFAGPEDNAGALEPFAHGKAEWALAVRLGVGTAIHGWLDGYASYLARRAELGFPLLRPTEGVGTTEYMRFVGGYGMTLECGTHGDPAGAEIGYAGIRAALAHLGLTDGPLPAISVTRAICITEALVVEREGDRIEGAWLTGDPVPKGALIARRADGTPVAMPNDGFLVFPNRAPKPGEPLLYLAVASERPLA